MLLPRSFIPILILLATSAAHAVSGPQLPARPEDWAFQAYGIWPYGVHSGGHALDGHPGWDLELKPGSVVFAAADGTVQSLVPDMHTPGRVNVQLEHVINGRRWRTVYSNIDSVQVRAGQSIAAGVPLGLAGVQTLRMGRDSVTFAMIHFQTDDFARSTGALSNDHAVDPSLFLGADARRTWEPLWRRSAYEGEWTEPYLANPRNVSFPLVRSWKRDPGASGGGPEEIIMTRTDPRRPEYDYEWRDAAGPEHGTATLEVRAIPLSTMTFVRSDGLVRRCVYDIVDGILRIVFATADDPRPASLAYATIYRTNPLTSGIQDPESKTLAASVHTMRESFPNLFLPDAVIAEADDIDRPRTFGEPDPPEGFAGPDPTGRHPLGIFLPAGRTWPPANDISREQWILHEMFHLHNRRTGEYNRFIDQAFPDESDPLVQWILKDPYHRTFAREEAFINLVSFADPARTAAQKSAVSLWYASIGAAHLTEDRVRQILNVVPHEH